MREDPGYADSGIEIIRVAGMEEAVKVAHEKAKSGDIVTLSPACASFDMFSDYEARGRIFKELVNKLD